MSYIHIHYICVFDALYKINYIFRLNCRYRIQYHKIALKIWGYAKIIKLKKLYLENVPTYFAWHALLFNFPLYLNSSFFLNSCAQNL